METHAAWHPWQDVRRMQREVERLFAEVAPAGRWPLTGDYPPLNLTRTENGVRLDAACPGVDRQSLDVTVVGDSLTIRCERKPEADIPPERYHRRERPVGLFTRSISLGERFDQERTKATYTEGILRVELAPADTAAPTKIPVQS